MFYAELSVIKRMCGAYILNEQPRRARPQKARIIMLLFVLLVLAVNTLYGSAQDDRAQANKEAVRVGLAEFSAGNPHGILALFPDTFLFNGQESALDESLALVLSTFRAAIPDLQIIPNVLIAQADWVASEFTWTGTFSNPINLGQELPPTH